MRRTFHTAVGLMDASEDFRFNQSTAHYYAQMEEDDPALFLRGDVYGTRASTLVTVAADGEVRMTERRYEASGRPTGTTALNFRIG